MRFGFLNEHLFWKTVVAQRFFIEYLKAPKISVRSFTERKFGNSCITKKTNDYNDVA